MSLKSSLFCSDKFHLTWKLTEREIWLTGTHYNRNKNLFTGTFLWQIFILLGCHLNYCGGGMALLAVIHTVKYLYLTILNKLKNSKWCFDQFITWATKNKRKVVWTPLCCCMKVYMTSREHKRIFGCQCNCNTVFFSQNFHSKCYVSPFCCITQMCLNFSGPCHNTDLFCWPDK